MESKSETIAKLNDILKDTGKSGKTKALYNYYRGIVDERVFVARDMLELQGVPHEQANAYMMYFYNHILNGSSPAGTGYLPASWAYEWLVTCPSRVNMSFDRVRASTLADWIRAIAAIDAAKASQES